MHVEIMCKFYVVLKSQSTGCISVLSSPSSSSYSFALFVCVRAIVVAAFQVKHERQMHRACIAAIHSFEQKKWREKKKE